LLVLSVVSQALLAFVCVGGHAGVGGLDGKCLHEGKGEGGRERRRRRRRRSRRREGGGATCGGGG